MFHTVRPLRVLHIRRVPFRFFFRRFWNEQDIQSALRMESWDFILCNHREEVFVVDDDEDLCEVIAWSLRNEGLRVRTFNSGESALAALTIWTPQLLIVDFNLGDMDACEFLQRKAGPKDLPVILVSGSPDEVKCAIPEEDYLSIVEKPLDLERLLREVKSLSGPYWQKSSSVTSTHSSHGPAYAE